MLIAHFVRRGGLRLSDLLSWDGRFGRAALLSIGVIIAEFGVGFVGGAVLTVALYGTAQGSPPIVAALPLPAALYALVVFPVIWAIAEEMTYQGYTLPRLQARTGQTWLAVGAVVLVFGLQHTALPLIVAHWVFNFLTVLTMIALPLLGPP